MRWVGHSCVSNVHELFDFIIDGLIEIRTSWKHLKGTDSQIACMRVCMHVTIMHVCAYVCEYDDHYIYVCMSKNKNGSSNAAKEQFARRGRTSRFLLLIQTHTNTRSLHVYSFTHTHALSCTFTRALSPSFAVWVWHVYVSTYIFA